VVNLAVQIACMLAAVFGCLMLGWILLVVAQRGLAALNVDFFTEPTPPPGVEGGGMGPAIVGTLVITATAACMGVPVGLLAGVFLAEYRGFRRASAAVRFAADLLMGVPSIITGIFVYALIVRTTGTFSAFAGAVALGIIMIPIITRTTEEMLRLVPNPLREAALALGAPRWKMISLVAYRAALSGILTGILLAVARIAGETAPLLFTALNNQFWSTDLMQPMANLPVVIFQFAMSPYEQWHTLAWAGSLLITLSVLILSIVARTLLRKARMENP
jgi:phosphate transport system permease protein